MARAKPVVLATRTFRTQGIAADHFAEMLGKYLPGDRVDDEDAADLAELLKRHFGYEEKVGPGIEFFTVGDSGQFASWCFFIVRVDGTMIDFSYKHCITGR